MSELRRHFSLSDEENNPLLFESNGFTFKAITNFNKIKLQISAQAEWDKAALEKHLKCALNTDPTSEVDSDVRAFWLGPNEWLFLSGELDTKKFHPGISGTLRPDTYAVTDLTDCFSIIELSGENIRELLMQNCSIDFDEKIFSVNQYRLSRFAQLPVIVYYRERPNTYWLIVDRSEASYLWDCLVHA